MNGYVRLETDADSITTLWLDAPGKSVNTLNRAMWADLAEALAFAREHLATPVSTVDSR